MSSAAACLAAGAVVFSVVLGLFWAFVKTAQFYDEALQRHEHDLLDYPPHGTGKCPDCGEVLGKRHNCPNLTPFDPTPLTWGDTGHKRRRYEGEPSDEAREALIEREAMRRKIAARDAMKEGKQ